MARRYWIVRGYDGSEETFERTIPKSRLPAMFDFRDFVDVGGLRLIQPILRMSYTVSPPRSLAFSTAPNPADIPF
jgi:hypothetical protein